ncbi:MAG: hypothetical protein WCK73_03925 [Deltaproteobacteria bacterium]
MTGIVRSAALTFLVAAVGCGGSSSSSSGLPAECSVVPVADHTSGGCKIRLAQPIGCQQVDLTGGKSATFEWTTDGTVCETPWSLCVGGSPSNFTTPSNAGCISIQTVGTVTRTTGIVSFTAADLAGYGLTSTSGVYYWTVQNWSGASYPATQAFRVLK